MIILLSPAKSLDFETKFSCKNYTIPHFAKETEKLAIALKKFSLADLEKLMGISKKLAELNFARFQNFEKKFDLENSRQALLAFDGDVYTPIEKNNFNEKDFAFAQNHIRILSGLYGLLRPLDLIQPYRLEMGTDFKKFKFLTKNLYEFWGDKISENLDEVAIAESAKHIINLASEEYFSAINPKKVSTKIINCIFKEKKGNQLRIVGINAKKARGLMTNFVIKNKILDAKNLKDFSEEKYSFAPKLSNESNFIFTR
jgi:cytoplasmic iron level regulating protein YaaA (DUF328/UPF0246 family)